MKNFAVLLFVTTLINFNTKAQNTQQAQVILERASVKLKSAPGIQSSFSIVQKDKYNHIQSNAEGIVKLKGEKYYLKQDDVQVFCNGPQTWNFDGENEVTVSKADDENSDELSPQKLLTGFDKKDFMYKLISSAGIYYQIQLTPADKRKNFKQIILFVNKSTNLVAKAKIVDKADNITEITFSNINLNAAIPDSQFNFDPSKHPGIEIINQ